MYNKITIELEKDIISKINSSGLHIATIKLILEKVLRMVNDALNEDLKRNNDDGTFAVLIKFNDGYLDSSTSTVSAGVGFNASGYGETKEDGTVVIKIGGDAVLEIDKEYINWDKKDSLHYDISVKKSNTTSNTLNIDENGKCIRTTKGRRKKIS